MRSFTGIQVFSATTHAQRHSLGETVTAWLETARTQRPGFQLVDIEVRQSSDHAYHCITICLLYNEDRPGTKTQTGKQSRD
jgi:hypothetical protein